MDFYTFDYEDPALEKYKSLHPGNNEDPDGTGGLKFSDPDTGAHFEYIDVCKRLAFVSKLRKQLDEDWGFTNHPPPSSELRERAESNKKSRSNSRVKTLQKYLSSGQDAKTRGYNDQNEGR